MVQGGLDMKSTPLAHIPPPKLKLLSATEGVALGIPEEMWQIAPGAHTNAPFPGKLAKCGFQVTGPGSH